MRLTYRRSRFRPYTAMSCGVRSSICRSSAPSLLTPIGFTIPPQAFRWLNWTTSKAVFEREIDPVARTGDARAALPVVAIVGDVHSKGQPCHVQSGERHIAARIGTELGLLAAV